MTRGRGPLDLRRRLRAVSDLRRRGSVRGTEQDWGATLGAALAELGPVPVAFAHYLAWRPDVLRLVCCEELASVRSRSPFLPAALVRRGLEAALGMSVREAFARFDTTPLVLDPLEQWHRAELPAGRAVLVQVERPDVAASLDEGMEVVLEICGLMADTERDGVPWRQLLEDFSAWVASRRDVEARRQLWTELQSDALLRDAWVWPVVVEDLSRGGLLVVEEPGGGRFLDRALRDGAGTAAAADLARRVSLAWLELAAFGGAFVEGLTGGDVLVLPDDRLLLLGGAPVPVDKEEADTFFDAVAATALGRPDAVWRALLGLAEAPAGSDPSARLLVRLRQASPIRDDGLGRQYRGVRLAESLFVSWRLLRQSGYEPRSALRRLATGVAALESHARTVGSDLRAASRDPLAEAVVDLQVMRGAAALRRALGPGSWRGRLEEALPLLSELPERLEAWIERRSPPPSPDVTGGRDLHSRWAALAVILALLGIVVAVAQRIGSSAAWIEHAAAVLCIVLGLGAVWVAWGRRSTIHRR